MNNTPLKKLFEKNKNKEGNSEDNLEETLEKSEDDEKFREFAGFLRPINIGNVQVSLAQNKIENPERENPRLQIAQNKNDEENKTINYSETYTNRAYEERKYSSFNVQAEHHQLRHIKEIESERPAFANVPAPRVLRPIMHRPDLQNTQNEMGEIPKTDYKTASEILNERLPFEQQKKYKSFKR